jgi:hypothetical protein
MATRTVEAAAQTWRVLQGAGAGTGGSSSVAHGPVRAAPGPRRGLALLTPPLPLAAVRAATEGNVFFPAVRSAPAPRSLPRLLSRPGVVVRVARAAAFDWDNLTPPAPSRATSRRASFSLGLSSPPPPAPVSPSDSPPDRPQPGARRVRAYHPKLELPPPHQASADGKAGSSGVWPMTPSDGDAPPPAAPASTRLAAAVGGWFAPLVSALRTVPALLWGSGSTSAAVESTVPSETLVTPVVEATAASASACVTELVPAAASAASATTALWVRLGWRVHPLVPSAAVSVEPTKADSRHAAAAASLGVPSWMAGVALVTAAAAAALLYWSSEPGHVAIMHAVIRPVLGGPGAVVVAA